MKRQIFIVDDTIRDAGGFLLTLHAVLADSLEKDQWSRVFKDIETFYIDILWDDKPADRPVDRLTDQSVEQQERETYFYRTRDEVTQHVQAAGVPTFSKMEYKSIVFNENDYNDAEKREGMAEEIINCISKIHQSGDPYVILLDIILNNNSDTREILHEKNVLSTILFKHKKIGDEHCIVYSTYGDFIYDDWEGLAGKASKCIRREWACRGRAIDLQYQEWLLHALRLNEKGGGEIDG